MKASELRIGNWVNVKQYPYENEPYKVTSLHGDNTFTIDFKGEIKGCFRTSIIEPTPLTEEWLLNMPDWFRELISDGYMNFSECPTGYVDVKFVHTAQNLYFALTGEELELK